MNLSPTYRHIGAVAAGGIGQLGTVLMITDAFLAGFLALLLILGLRNSFVWVLAYIYVDILAPAKIGLDIMPTLQPSLLTFLVAFAGLILSPSKHARSFTFRQGLLVLLLIYCFVTTQWSLYPTEASAKWDWVWKALFFATCLPLFLTTRLRIEGALLIMLISVSTIIISAGAKIALGSGGYGRRLFLVNDNSGLYESSTLATVAICIIPLILWMNAHGKILDKDWRMKLFSAGLIGASLLIPIGTEARTGLLCMALLALFGLRDSRRKGLFITAACLVTVAVIPFLPESYKQRMDLIENHESDESASTRVAVWKWTWDYAKDHPFGGGFMAYMSNSFTYKIPVKIEYGAVQKIEMREVTDRARAYHSAIFEMLGEQGYPGLFLWLLLHGTGIVQMQIIRRKWRAHMRHGRAEGEEWVAPLATALQYAQLIYLLGSLFQGIAFQPFVLLLIGIQCAFGNYCGRLESIRSLKAKSGAGSARPRDRDTTRSGPALAATNGGLPTEM